MQLGGSTRRWQGCTHERGTAYSKAPARNVFDRRLTVLKPQSINDPASLTSAVDARGRPFQKVDNPSPFAQLSRAP